MKRIVLFAAAILFVSIKAAHAQTTMPTARPVARKVVAYYFHGDSRCSTCKTIEAYTREALQTGFASELQQGTLEFRVVNIDLAENEHFVDDFQLTTRSVVIQEAADGKPGRWKRLDGVWRVVDDRARFFEYVQPEVRALLGGS